MRKRKTSMNQTSKAKIIWKQLWSPRLACGLHKLQTWMAEVCPCNSFATC